MITNHFSPSRVSLAFALAGFLCAIKPTLAVADSPTKDLGDVARIDRKALVTRNEVQIAKPDPFTPLTVGNGEFAFTTDITGLQTFPEFHAAGIPLGTLAQWGWHSFPNPDDFAPADALSLYEFHGRTVPYLDGVGGWHNSTNAARAKAANAWLRANPHRMPLGRVGLRMRKADGTTAALTDLAQTAQTLDLWRGVLESRFVFDGQAVRVLTICHPDRDLLAVRVESPLVASGRLEVEVTFAYPAGDWRDMSDWQKPGKHTTTIKRGKNRADLARVLDSDKYFARLAWTGNAELAQSGRHEFRLAAAGKDVLEFTVAFSPNPVSGAVVDFADTEKAAARHWREFWSTGGAVDLAASKDPRAAELERRVVLSQYLTAINCAGSLPPQETGLTANSWFGKFHLEMHWWHAAHFALWGREALLERSLPWYQSILPAARETARLQGFNGARWPKMTSPRGVDSPSPIGPFLIWQEPHPIFYAELMYRARPSRETLERWRDVVFETANFMASYPTWDEVTKRFVLGPALIPAQESYGRERQRVINPTFELAYWHWALDTAQRWRERLGLRREPAWDRVVAGFSRPTVRDGAYAAIEVEPFTVYHDHPSMLGALGMVPPTPLIDAEVMRRTLADVRARWDWPGTWGWDYPLMAMTAARLGEPEAAVDALLISTPKNRYLVNGHNYQRDNLPLYLPGNGGLLYAVAMMAGGWDGAAPGNAPGFPTNGQWTVRSEGLRKAP